MTWRYLAQDLVTGQWVHPDLPLSGVEIERAVSAPGGIDAFIAPEVIGMVDSVGRPLLREWATAIYAEHGDTIRGAGILARSTLDESGEKWSIECPGFTSYPHGIPYLDVINRWDADPFQLTRAIWNHVQSYPDGDIGMTIDQGMSPVKTSPSRPPARPEQPKGALKAPKKGPKPKKGKNESTSAYNARVSAWESTYATARAAYEAAKKQREKNKVRLKKAQEEWDREYGDRKPYQLSWWEAPDCDQEIDRLATETPFDYVEQHWWEDSSKQVVRHHLHMAQPTVGRRRTDLRFVVGENVTVIPETERDGDEFANGIIGLGKGEGRDMLRVEINRRDGRLRRPRASSYKDVGTVARLRALSNTELQQRIAMTEVSELVVVDHPNAPLGSWSLGDEVAVMLQVPGWESERVWCRVVSEVVRPDEDQIVLTVVNAERVVS